MRYADGPTAEASTFIDATPEVVWRWVTDIGLPAQVSGELQETRWLDEGTDPAIGRRFAGKNFHPAMGEWETVCTIITSSPNEEFAWAVGDCDDPIATWRFRLRADGEGCELTQSGRMGPGRSGISVAIERMPEKEERIIERRLQEFQRGIEGNLARIKELSEAA